VVSPPRRDWVWDGLMALLGLIIATLVIGLIITGVVMLVVDP
jgi:hypothetical protein